MNLKITSVWVSLLVLAGSGPVRADIGVATDLLPVLDGSESQAGRCVRRSIAKLFCQ